jgi:hypothetical protein
MLPESDFGGGSFDKATQAGAQASVFITDNALFSHRKEVGAISAHGSLAVFS